MDPQEARWEIIKSLLESFPSLKKMTSEYLNVNDSAIGNESWLQTHKRLINEMGF